MVSYPELNAMSDQQQKVLLDELKLHMLELALTDKNTQAALKQRMGGALQALQGKP
jgi:hypothetical protein